ncbi:MAG: hypothetical protein IJK81_04855 [Selenomonadaceae bacterium]|nr:hypothetical protein [Selenomonadaceae bacterium]
MDFLLLADFFYCALLNRLADNPNDTFQFDVKIDANQILQEKHEDFLRTLTQELIDSARADFDSIEKDIAVDFDFKNKISAWQSQNHNNPIAPPVVEELKAAISYVDSLSLENFNPLDIDDLVTRRKIALLKFYVSTLARKFFNILHDILPDEETLVALIHFLDYAATGECSEEKALLFNGGGGNGKGTLTRTLIILFGSYATTLKTSAVLLTGKAQDSGAATTGLNPLENCRVAIIEELPQGGKLDVAKFKNFTGSDFISIRRLHQEQINIEPHFSPILSGNYLTELSDTRDPRLLRRLMNIYFTQSFIGKKRDPHLKEKLASLDALSGFLSLIVEAAKLWYRDGLLL